MPWQKPSNLHEWLGLILRHKKKFFYPAVLCMTLVIWASQGVPREYQAEAKFKRQSDLAQMQMREGSNMQIVSSLRRQLEEDVRGRPAVQQLIKDLELTRNLPHFADGQLTPEGRLAEYDLVKRIQQQLRVYYQTFSDTADLVVVSYTGSDPELASRVVNRAVENYISKTRDQLSEMLMKARDFFQNEVIRHAARVEELEAKKLRFSIDNPGLAPDDPASVQNRLAELRTKRDTVEQALLVAAQQRNRLAEFLKDQPEFLENRQRGQNPAVAERVNKLRVVEAELEQHRTMGRKDAHPLVKKATARQAELQAEIAKLEPEVEVGKELVPNTGRLEGQQRLEMLIGEVTGLERQRDDLTAQIERYEVMNRNFFVIRNEYMRIERELSEASGQLKFWDDNLRRTRTALTAEVGQRGVRLSFDQRAPELARPSWPTVWGILSVALVIGLGAGVFMIVIAELLDTSFHSVDQAVDGLKLPVLGAVNLIVTPAQTVRRRLLHWAFYPSLTVVAVLVLLASIYLTWMSIEDPIRYQRIQRLMDNPTNYIRTAILGS